MPPKRKKPSSSSIASKSKVDFEEKEKASSSAKRKARDEDEGDADGAAAAATTTTTPERSQGKKDDAMSTGSDGPGKEEKDDTIQRRRSTSKPTAKSLKGRSSEKRMRCSKNTGLN